ncbi:two pore domain potassium channel family protein [Amylibacter sp. SFDW26]|uniref:ion channel n=1 Tax=Amylibacter sp. SFDW26 TaxID=2652722 RepID=UPI0012621EBD|nr:ion channel [Amylibacter sp. SFDW26]KAB7614391.1 two pore domain potassium channel family protein [Amylibacter sp. SFDW26]
MTVLSQILLGTVILVLCSLIHSVILVWSINTLKSVASKLESGNTSLRIVIFTTIALTFVVLAHTIQVWVWAISFISFGALETLSDSIYFALITYTTLGYGDIVLGEAYRIYGAMAAVTGLLNFGLSTAFLVGLASRFLPK